MNIVPKGVPQASPTASTNSQPAQSARERAISKLVAPEPVAERNPSAPIPTSPNNVSPEELGSVVQKHTSETPSVESPVSEPAKVEESLSSQYAVFARKEKQLRAKAQAQEAAIKQRELALQQREEAIKAKDAEYQSKYILKDKLTNPDDTLNTLIDAGLSYDQITQLMLNQPDAQTQAQIQYQKKIDAKLAALEAAQERAEKTAQEQQKQQYDQALGQITLEAKNLIEGDPDTYEAIKATGSVKDVVKLIETTFKEDGVLMTVEDAAAEVEEYLIEEASKLSRLKKIQQMLNRNAQKASSPQATPVQKSSQPQLKTLTNSVGSSGKLSAKERAILAFKGELKN